MHIGGILVRQVKRDCCRWETKKARLQEQRMGDLLEERVDVGFSPFKNISLDFMRLVLVKAMVMVRAQMKVQPLVFCCLLTRAVHVSFTLLWYGCFSSPI